MAVLEFCASMNLFSNPVDRSTPSHLWPAVYVGAGVVWASCTRSGDEVWRPTVFGVCGRPPRRPPTACRGQRMPKEKTRARGEGKIQGRRVRLGWGGVGRLPLAWPDVEAVGRAEALVLWLWLVPRRLHLALALLQHVVVPAHGARRTAAETPCCVSVCGWRALCPKGRGMLTCPFPPLLAAISTRAAATTAVAHSHRIACPRTPNPHTYDSDVSHTRTRTHTRTQYYSRYNAERAANVRGGARSTAAQAPYMGSSAWILSLRWSFICTSSFVRASGACAGRGGAGRSKKNPRAKEGQHV